MDGTEDAFFCGDIGTNATFVDCCLKDPVDDCDFIFDPLGNWFQRGCNATGNCAVDCQNLTHLYNYAFNPNDAGVNDAAIAPWTTCINVPNVAALLLQGVLAPNISELVEQEIPLTITTEALQNITRSVTQCLTSTCSQARNPNICADACSPVKLITNQTMPNYAGLNGCMFSLCTNGYDAVPFANADIIGIGVFSSYVMQCAIILLIWLLFAFFCILLVFKSSFFKKETVENQRDKLVTGLVEFHKTQCFFSSTIQVAALAYGLYSTNLLTVFLVIPLATNGIVPVVFGHLLVLRFGRSSMYLTTLTCIPWVLSSLVYWSLYMHVAQINWNVDDYDVYEAIMYTLSENNDCGGSSALAACPENMIAGIIGVEHGGNHIRHWTPILWTWGTLMLFFLVGYQICQWLLKRNGDGFWSQKTKQYVTLASQKQAAIQTPSIRALTSSEGIFWLVTLVFVGMMGLQLALLYIDSSIKFFNGSDWTFGQIVAVTIWLPPLVEYVNVQMKGLEAAAEYRLAKHVKVTHFHRLRDLRLPLMHANSGSPKDAPKEPVPETEVDQPRNGSEAEKHNDEE